MEYLTVDDLSARVRELGPVYDAPAAADVIRAERDSR
jgi:hypothetical protein